MTFTCPECEHEPFPTIKGWKRHMTAMHGGYSPGQLHDATGGSNEGTAITGEQSLESAIARLPINESTAEQESAAEQPPPSKEQRAAAKRIKAKFDALRERFSGEIPEQILEFGGVTLTDKQKQLLAESIDTSFEVIGINFEVQPFNITIRNPFLILLYPIFVIAFIVVSKIIEAHNDEESNKGKPQLPNQHT